MVLNYDRVASIAWLTTFSKKLHLTAMFVTCTPQGPVKEHPKEVVVLETSASDTVLASQNDPVKVTMVLE